MDYTSIIATVFVIGTIFCLVILIVYVADSNRKSYFKKKNINNNTTCKFDFLYKKNEKGERQLSDILNFYLPSDFYKIINDVMLEVDGVTHQIDHVVISQFGVFVIETKDYSGIITGGEYDNKWVRHFKNGKKMYYENPIKQNYGHVKCIQELFGLNDNQVINLVFLTDKSKINIKHNGELTRSSTIINRIMSYGDVVITNYEDLYNKMLNANITDINKRNEHILKIRSRLSELEYDTDRCPKCGSRLIYHENGNNMFLGCERYPDCNYTRNISK